MSITGAFMTERCDDCDTEYVVVDQKRVRQCPQCAAIEDAQYEKGVVGDIPTWKYSRTSMQERLGVTGRDDS